jgi:hypothetical protein
MDRAPTLQVYDQRETRHRPEHQRADYDYKEIAREVLARIDQRLADLERDAPPRPAERRPAERDSEADGDTVADVMSREDQAAFTRMALRGLFGLAASAVVVAAVVWLWFHGDTAKRAATEWASGLVASSAAREEKAQTGAEPGPPSTANAVAAVPVQAASPPRPAADNDKPAPAPVPPELAEQMRKVDRNVAGLAQAVNELRTALQQVSDNNAKAVEEVKADVDQLARTVVRAEQAEQAVQPVQPVQPKSSAPAPTPRTAAPGARNRRYMYMSPYDAQAQFLR